MTEQAPEPTDIIGAPDTWPVVEKGGRLVKVPLSPGRFIKLTVADARARGLLPPEEKAQPPAPNKARRGARNKSQPVESTDHT